MKGLKEQIDTQAALIAMLWCRIAKYRRRIRYQQYIIDRMREDQAPKMSRAFADAEKVFKEAGSE